MPPRANQVATLTIVAIASTLLLVAAGGRGEDEVALRAPPSSWRGLFDKRPAVTVGQRMIVVLRAPSLAQEAARRRAPSGAGDQRRWTAAAFASQQQLLARLAAKGARIRPGFRYARALNGFAAVLDARALALLEAERDVAGVYPVRVAYPAASPSPMPRQPPPLERATLPGFDGRGVTIAVLDTGIDLEHPYLRPRVLAGLDLVGGARTAAARARPDRRGGVERHGTEIAGLLAGRGPGVAGVAPGASLLPIRVAGWQQDSRGEWAIFARTDQIVAGIDRALDPDDDGAAEDAADIVLVPLAEPFAAFADSPLARAAAGALRLGALVVAPAGNDGPARPVFGSVSGPAGAPAVLAVGAADTRRQATRVRVVLRAGLDVVFNRLVPLAGARAPRGASTHELAAVEGVAEGAPVSVRDFFDERGYSRVAGRVALLPADTTPETTVQNAARAGAAAVIFHGGAFPPGALGTTRTVPLPVVGVPAAVARSLRDALRRGRVVTVSLTASEPARNNAAGRVASFSSRGLSFDGRIKPDVLAPGVGLATTEPTAGDGVARVGTITGSSAAAAIVAGGAAMLLQARPRLGAKALKSVLVETARPTPGDPVVGQGGGLVDVARAAAVEVATEPTAVALGPAVGAGALRPRTLVVRNVSSRRLVLHASVLRTGLRRAVRVGVRPRRIELPVGGRASLTIVARVTHAPGPGKLAQGAIVLTPFGGAQVRIPWAIGFRPARIPLLADVRLSHPAFRPSDAAPAVLTFQAGSVAGRRGRLALHPVSRLDVELWRTPPAGATRLGLLARLRDLLPGRYAFGLTGRGPRGKVLPPGDYRLRLVAFPTAGGPSMRRTVPFTVK